MTKTLTTEPKFGEVRGVVATDRHTGHVERRLFVARTYGTHQMWSDYYGNSHPWGDLINPEAVTYDWVDSEKTQSASEIALVRFRAELKNDGGTRNES